MITKTAWWVILIQELFNLIYSESPDGFYDYDLTTPFKAMGSIAFVYGKYGLLSADYEFKDNSDARFHAGSSSFSDVNNLIRQKYSETHTVRIGTEWLFRKHEFKRRNFIYLIATK